MGNGQFRLTAGTLSRVTHRILKKAPNKLFGNTLPFAQFVLLQLLLIIRIGCCWQFSCCVEMLEFMAQTTTLDSRQAEASLAPVAERVRAHRWAAADLHASSSQAC